MKQAIRQKGDRAALLMCSGGLALFALGGFSKMWVGRHAREFTQIVCLGGPKSWTLMVLVLALAATWLLSNLFGIIVAYRLRAYASLRCASTAAAVGVVATIFANSGILPRTLRMAWTILVWLPIAATVVVFAASALWLRERRLLPGPEAAGQE